MTDTHETIADIIAAKRRLAAEMEKALGDQHASVEMLKDDADRIDAAKLREALITIRDKAHEQYVNDNGIDTVWIQDVANAALAAPARNCDRFLTLDDAKHAYSEYLQGAGRRRMAGLDVEALDEIDWCYAPAEGGAR